MTGPAMRSIPARRRRSRLLPLVVVLLVAVPILEVWLLIQVGQWLGVWPTVAILVAEALLGALLLRREGSRTWRGLNEAFGTGRMPTRELTDAALVLVGGVLLMLPGFATDVVGFLCLVPFTRRAARALLGYLVARRVTQVVGEWGPQVGPHLRSGIVVEGETVEAPRGSGSADAPVVISGEIEERRR